MASFISDVVDFNDIEFQNDLRRLRVSTIKLKNDGPSGYEFYEFIGSEKALKMINFAWFHYDDLQIDFLED
tara:strand:+ start:371 stop:583 length:213 start_codon:yes stop_codon:yes gene_type:complete